MDEIQRLLPAHNCLSAGKSGLVYALDEGRVLKEYFDKGIEVESRILSKLGPHDNIVTLLGRKDNGLVLERGQSLREVLHNNGTNNAPIDMNQRQDWIRQAAIGLRHIHEKDIIHADVGCQNLILVGKSIKYIDFEGSSIDGEEATSCYQWFSYRVSRPAISIQTDIFAFGCTTYEIMTGKPPYHELENAIDRMYEVQQLYSANRFPDVQELSLGEVIQGCWEGMYDSMNDVIRALHNHGIADEESNV